MKKIAIVAAAAVLALALAGCGSQAASSSAESSSSLSASDTAASSSAESSSAASSQTSTTVEFTDVKTADEAAKGAGIAKFGVMNTIKIDDVEFKDPRFSYADGVAQALYEQGAVGIIVRKADGAHKAPLSERDKTEFANTWTKSYEGLDVSCYGPAKGAATVFTWADGTAEYCVTYQGLGGEEVTLDSDDVGAIVKGLKEANATQQPKKEEDSSDEAEEMDEGAEALDGMDPEAIIWQQGLGEVLSTTKVQLNDGKWYWEVECRGANGNEKTYVIDVNGNVSDVSGDQDDDDEDEDADENEDGEIGSDGADVLDGMDPEAIVQQQGLGQFESATQVQLDDGQWYWEVECKDVNGESHTFYIDQNANVSEG